MAIVTPVESNWGVPVNVQNQTTKSVLCNFNNVKNSTTLTGQAAKGSHEITLASVVGATAGSYIIIFDPPTKKFSFYTQVGAPVGNVITLDSPLDYAYPEGALVDISSINMAVDGSTPVTYGLRGINAPPGVGLSVDITGVLFYCVCDSAVTLDLFGNIPALSNGLVLRKRNNTYENIANIKTNGDIAAVAESFTITASTNPVQGQDGFYGSAPFAGQGDMGVAVRLPMGDDLEFIVQDDLSGITALYISALGHIVTR